MSPTPWPLCAPRRWQRDALSAVLTAYHEGTRRAVVQAPCGAGKSLWLAELAALCRGEVLVTTPTQALVEQLSATLETRAPGQIGQAYQHAWTTDRRIVVTCAASLPRLLAERPRWTLWICDEAHRGLPGVEGLHADYGAALTATPYRGLAGWDRLVYALTAAEAVRDGILVDHRAVRWDGELHADVPRDQRTDAVVRSWVLESEGPGVITAETVADAERYAATIPDVAAIHGYQSRAVRAERIEALRTGALRALVTVHLLTQGVDLPWLRWLALRVPIRSPVRLVQLVGRVLRAAPGKGTALVYDPHALLDAIGLTHTAVLDEVLGRQEPEPVEEWEIPELADLPHLASLPEPVAVGRLEGWVADLAAAVRAYGLQVRTRPPHEDAEWRRTRASEAQRVALEGLVRGVAIGRLPSPYRQPYRWLLQRDGLTAGAAQDAIDTLRAISKRWSQGPKWWMLPESIVPRVPE